MTLTLAEVLREAKSRDELSRSAILVIPVSRKESGKQRKKQTFFSAKNTRFILRLLLVPFSLLVALEFMPRKSVSLHHVSKAPIGGKEGAF